MRAAPITVVLAVTILVAGCGTSRMHKNQVLFQQRCGSCHALDPNQLSPVAAAPNLSTLKPTRAQIEHAIEHGAPGMPDDLVKGDDIQHIIDYILQETSQ